MTNLDLSLRNRLHLGFHNILAATGADGLKRVKICRENGHFTLETTGETIRIPAALVWRSYRRGWAARLARISRDFGLCDPFPVGEGDTVIDIGANVGDFSRAAAALGATVFSFDGDPKVFECLKLNIANAPGIHPDQAILWKEPGPLTFYSAPDKSDSSIFLPPGKNVMAMEVEATTLDALAEKHGIGEVTLLKMDAEGAEPEVIEGGKGVLSRTRYVAIDTGPERNGESTDAACEEILKSFGFKILPNIRTKRKITMATREG